MSGRPQRKRNAPAPAPPPAINFHHLNPHDRIDAHIIHTDDLADRYNKAQERIKENTERCCEQQNAKIKKLEEAVEKLTGMCTTVTGELKECKERLKKCEEKVKVLEEGQAARDRVDDGGDDDDDDGADDFRGGHDDRNGGGMDFDDMDLGGDDTNGNNDDGSDERREDGSEGRGDNAGADEDMDQRNGEVEESGGSAPIGGEAEGMQVALMNRDLDPEVAGNRAAEPSSPDAHPGQPKTGVPKQKTFSLENLQHLLENGNILGLLEAINENLAKLTPFFAGPGIREISEVLSKLQDVEQKRIQGGKPAKRRKMDGELYNPENLLLSDDTIFYVRSFEQLYVVIMKRRQTIADLKKILEEKTGKNAESLRCFVGSHLLLDCYEIRESKIEDHCLVHVSEGNPDIPASFSTRQ